MSSFDGHGPAFADSPTEPVRHKTWRLQKDEERMGLLREDIAAWLSRELNVELNADELFENLQTGVLLCKLAQHIESTAKADVESKHHGDDDDLVERNKISALNQDDATSSPSKQQFAKFINLHKNKAVWKDVKRYTGMRLKYFSNATPNSFQARDNAVKFIKWCKALGLPDVILFESNDLVEGKNERKVLQCLLEIARFAALVGVAPSELVAVEIEMAHDFNSPFAEHREISSEPIQKLFDDGDSDQQHDDSEEESQNDDEEARQRALQLEAERQRQIDEERRRQEEILRQAEELKRLEEEAKRQQILEQEQEICRSHLSSHIAKSSKITVVEENLLEGEDLLTASLTSKGSTVTMKFQTVVLLTQLQVNFQLSFPITVTFSHSLDGRRWRRVSWANDHFFYVTKEFNFEPSEPALCQFVKLELVGNYNVEDVSRALNQHNGSQFTATLKSMGKPLPNQLTVEDLNQELESPILSLRQACQCRCVIVLSETDDETPHLNLIDKHQNEVSCTYNDAQDDAQKLVVHECSHENSFVLDTSSSLLTSAIKLSMSRPVTCHQLRVLIMGQEVHGDSLLDEVELKKARQLMNDMSEELVLLQSLVTGLNRAVELIETTVLPEIDERQLTADDIVHEVKQLEKPLKLGIFRDVSEQINDVEDEVLALLEDSDSHSNALQMAALEYNSESRTNRITELFRSIRGVVGPPPGPLDDEDDEVDEDNVQTRLWKDYESIVKLGNEVKRLSSQLELKNVAADKDAESIFKTCDEARTLLSELAPENETPEYQQDIEERKGRRRKRRESRQDFNIPADRPFDPSGIGARVDAYNAWFDEYKRQQKKQRVKKVKDKKIDVSHVKSRIDTRRPESFKPSSKKKKITNAPMNVSNVSSRIDSGSPGKVRAQSTRNRSPTKKGDHESADRLFVLKADAAGLKYKRLDQGKYLFRDEILFTRELRGRVMVRRGSDWLMLDSFIKTGIDESKTKESSKRRGRSVTRSSTSRATSTNSTSRSPLKKKTSKSPSKSPSKTANRTPSSTRARAQSQSERRSSPNKKTPTSSTRRLSSQPDIKISSSQSRSSSRRSSAPSSPNRSKSRTPVPVSSSPLRNEALSSRSRSATNVQNSSSTKGRKKVPAKARSSLGITVPKTSKT